MITRKLIILSGIVLLLLTGCRAGYPGVPEPSVRSKPGPTFSTTIYLPQRDGLLSAKQVELKATPNRPRAALTALFDRDEAFFPKGVRVLGLRIDPSGQATANLSRQILDKKVSDQKAEALGLGAIVRTLAEFKNIKRVGLQVEGRSSGRVGGRQIDEFWGFSSLKLQPFALK